MNLPSSSSEGPGPEAYLATAVNAARAGGDVLMDYLNREFKVEYKGRINLVTEADHASQDAILGILREAFPTHEFLAEESDPAERDKLSKKGFLWVIDPLDGTTNYVHGYRCFSVSIALTIDGIVAAGVVYDPWGDEMFTAVKGEGAFLNGETIAVSKENKLERSLLVTGFPYDIREGMVTNLGLFNHLITKAQAVRRDGSAALDLAYIAAGRFDGLWELKLNPWDIAAGILLIDEAGGSVSTFSGSKFQLTSLDLLATNSLIHQQMIASISEIPRDSW